MKTIEINLYSFDELGEKAKEKAINNFRNTHDNYHIFSEIIDTCKKVAALFGLKFGREYATLLTGHIDDDILNLSGERLYKYIVNNYWYDLFTPKYKKHINRELKGKQFIFKSGKDYKGEKYTFIYSRNFFDNDCVLTGVCWDYDILKPVYDFLKKPEKDTNFQNLIDEIGWAIQKTFNDCEDWLNSREFIIDEIEANGYEFTEDGEIY
jgi:hypothetical protein